MNSATLQNIKSILKNQLGFFVLTMDNPKKKLKNKKKTKKNTSVYNSIKKNKIFRDKHNQGGKRPVLWKLQNVAERN